MTAVDAVIVGAGHAGIEAANILNLLNIKTLLISHSLEKIGYPSCNPSIGGIGKSHLVYELDVLGGIMPIISDITGIHFKLLNSSKGPAVWSLRSQIDTDRYTHLMKQSLMNMKNVELIEDEVIDIFIDNNVISGVKLLSGNTIKTKKVIIAAGTFLNGEMFIGHSTIKGGRFYDPSSMVLAENLKKIGFKTERLKTGTSPRVKKCSIDFSKMQAQEGEDNIGSFSIINEGNISNNTICYITRTNKKTHKIISDNIDSSALYSGKITGIGPKYCPSIEDKITRFNNRDSHTVFIEPMGINSDAIYLNGISTSLPEDKQYEFIRTIQGLENIEFLTPGYAIEYDYFTHGQLKHTLETLKINGLFFAGQINGTSGYEEAAAQGYVAGLNAGLSLLDHKPIVFDRYSSYIGVLIDDIIRKDIKEPYRLFTSRAENRLALRQDNAFKRLEHIASSIPASFPQTVHYKKIHRKTKKIEETIFNKRGELTNNMIKFKNPAIPFDEFQKELNEDNRRVALYLYSEIKYKGYIERFERLRKKINKMENVPIHNISEILKLHIISKEAIDILNRSDVKTIGELKGIIDPSDIENIILYLEKRK